MNRILFALAFAISLALPTRASQHAAGNYVVVLEGNMSPDTVLRQHGLGASRKWHVNNGFKGFAARLSGPQADRLEQDTRVKVIEPDVTVNILSQTLPAGVRRIGCQSNARWVASTTTPIDVDVAIIDTGIDLTHPDLNVWQNVSFTTAANGNDDHGHGTHCAGIVGAQNNGIGVVGVAPGCRLWAVKVLDSTGSGSLSQIISGVDYVTQHASEIEVANMSLGGQGSSDSLRLAIQNSVAAGVVYVVAAGNSNYDVYGGDIILGGGNDFFPASYPEVITVSAMADTDGTSGGLGPATAYGADDSMATFSNYSLAVDSTKSVKSPGLAIDLVAPGVNVYSTYKNGGYSTLSGTSMASPHVAGAAALYIAQFGRATTATQVHAIGQALVNGGTAPTTWGNANWNPHPLFDFYPEPLVNAAWGGSPPPPPADYPPLLSIDQPPSGTSVPQSTVITLVGSALDTEDGDLGASITWTDSVAGALGAGASVTYTPAVGAHTVTASVTDSGAHTVTTTVTLTVTAPPLPPPAPQLLTVTVAANKAVYVNKEKAYITTTVRQGAVAVSGASVTVQIRSGSRFVTTKTGTTTSAGTYSFYLPIQKSKYGTGAGPFTATVTADASKTGSVSGTSSTTFLVY